MSGVSKPHSDPFDQGGQVTHQHVESNQQKSPAELVREALDDLYHSTDFARGGRSETWEEARRALDGLEEQLEASQRELRDATRLVSALVYRTNKASGVLLYPLDLDLDLTLSRYDNPVAKTVHLFASNPAMSPSKETS